MKITAIISLFFVLFFIPCINAEEIERITFAGEDDLSASMTESDLEILHNSPALLITKILEDINYLHTNCVEYIDSRIMQRMAIEKLNEIEDLCLTLYYLYYLVPDDHHADNIIDQIDDESFHEFIVQLEDETFTDDKISLLKLAVEDNYFSVDQLCIIMDMFDFEEDKVASVRIVFPKIIDYGNSFKLITKVDFSDSKEEIHYIITGK